MDKQTLAVAADAVAAGSSAETELGAVSVTGSVASVTWTPDAAVTGANTNTRLLQVIDRGTDGSGTTVVASLQFNSGTNAVKAVPLSIPLQGSATGPDGARFPITAGHVLAFVSSAVGTGIADPGGEVVVTTETYGTI